MKKYLFTLMFVLFGASAVMGQKTEVPDAFDCEEGCWLTSIISDLYIFPEYIMAYRLCNDTVIDGDVWKKLYSHKIHYSDIKTMNIDFSAYDYGNAIGCMRNDNGKIYGMALDNNAFMHPLFIDNNEKVLLYDFSKEVGESVEKYDLRTYSDTYSEVTGYAEVLSDVWNGYERKYYDTGFEDFCVEGIGDTIDGPFGIVQGRVTGSNPNLIYCSADGEAIFGSMPYEHLKFIYDVFQGLYGTSTKWTVGRVKDGKVIEKYTLNNGVKDGQFLVSSLAPNKKIDIIYNRDFYNYKSKLYCTIDATKYLCYDFSLKEGDTFDNGIKRMTVKSVETLMVEGFERFVLTFDNGEQWIDGLGSTRGLLSPVTEDSEDYEEVLLSCVAGGTVMYVNPEYGSGINETEYLKSEIRLNGTVLEITAPEDASHIVAVYDAGGNAVVRKTFDGAEYTLSVSSLQQGLYIVAVDGIACGKIVL